MSILGYSLDNLSLLALTLSRRFRRRRSPCWRTSSATSRLGEPPLQAAIRDQKIGFTIISMTISLIAVFIPVCSCSGIVGRLLHECRHHLRRHPWSPASCLTLTPMLCSAATSNMVSRIRTAISRCSNVFEALLASYEKTLRLAMATRAPSWPASSPRRHSYRCYPVHPAQGLHSERRLGQITATEGARGPPSPRWSPTSGRFAEIVAGPRISPFMSAVGATGIRPTANTGTLFMILKPPARPQLSADQIIQRLR